MFEVHTMKKKLAEVEVYLEQAWILNIRFIRQYALDTLHAGGKRVRPTLSILTAGILENEDNIVPLGSGHGIDPHVFADS